MISKNKTYRTRDNREVRIYATDGHPDEPVHGAFKDNDGQWNQSIWMLDGKCRFNETVGGHRVTDLVEVKHRIKQEYWVNVYADGASFHLLHKLRATADRMGGDRIACVKVVIDCEEGEGL